MPAIAGYQFINGWLIHPHRGQARSHVWMVFGLFIHQYFGIGITSHCIQVSQQCPINVLSLRLSRLHTPLLAKQHHLIAALHRRHMLGWRLTLPRTQVLLSHSTLELRGYRSSNPWDEIWRVSGYAPFTFVLKNHFVLTEITLQLFQPSMFGK